ncbi:hypothetical protein CP98_02160 [Sphingobium yanoikuyae]|uniref:DUF5672 domain-containing protein n=1 Tax=Sphingobium yanoikuyae TaxID=13690 RepID=A0A084EMQ6_SPHYA|nr:DUF5672 family protein [Sphingobium yanoikuyae]KEZ19248.1 hypothetical protein CP98_02160 [Sphingobium yanoikuyae]
MTAGNASPTRLSLPQVTLCAATSVNVSATIRALEVSLSQIDFAACKLFTDAMVRPEHPAITVIPIDRMTSSQAYSDFVLTQMVDHIETSHCLIAQWDGHVLDASRWRPDFLDYDYIGASWPQFGDGHDVGNGGFSLRSHILMETCRDPSFLRHHPEDVAIGRMNRLLLEERGMRFAPRTLADIFSSERAGNLSEAFGYHGSWHMPNVIGIEEFWMLYCELDDRSTIRHDLANIMKQMWTGHGGLMRVFRLFMDQAFSRYEK